MTLGLELGESSARAVIVDNDGRVVGRAEHKTGAGIAHAARDAVRRLRETAKRDVEAAGVATIAPGETLPPEVAAAIGDAVAGAPLLTIGAGAAAAIAETWCGAARGLNTVITFALGEHVTSGLLVAGKPWLGAHGYAGSTGWLAVNPVEREDYRRLGALEAEVAAAGIVRRLVWRVKSGDQSTVVDKVRGDLNKLTAAMVFDGARGGDGVCISVVRDTTRYVGMAVANLAAVVDPEAIVLGGTIAGLGEMMLEPIRTECARRLNPAQNDRVRLLLSTLGDDAVAIGAARAAALQAQ